MKHTIDTPLGALTVRVVGLDSTDYRIGISTPKIELPPGMSVDGIAAAVIQITPTRSGSTVRCECVWDRAPALGDIQSGECLDAQSWDVFEQRVTMGTEDYDALRSRLPSLDFCEGRYSVSYADEGLTVEIPNAPKGCSFSLHFVIAWRSLPDPADCSTWFAVDIPHAAL